jgi:hypothetical protein
MLEIYNLSEEDKDWILDKGKLKNKNHNMAVINKSYWGVVFESV